jgi:L-rhamnonate dehydratase
MKIANVEAFHLRGAIEALPDSSMEALLVKITTDTGLVGWGESDGCRAVNKSAIEAPYSSIVVAGLKGLLLGENPMDVTRLWHKMYDGTMYCGRDGAFIHAMAGIDLALWDLKGKALGVPVNQLLGGAHRDGLQVYASVLFEETPEANAALAKKIVDEGYRAMKLGWRNFGHGTLEFDLATLDAIRKAVGYDIKLAVDLGFAWRPKQAMQRARAFEPYDLMWIEEPFKPDDLLAYEMLCGSVDMPIAAGEEEASVDGYVRLMDAGLDYLQIDLCKTGLTLAMKVAAIAEQRGIPCINHNFSNDFNTAASLHFLSAIPNAFIMEYGYNPADLSRHLTTTSIAVEDGYARVPTAPGLGVEPDPAVIAKYLVA